MTHSLPVTEYSRRRQQLLAQLPCASAVLLPAAKLRYRNRDAEHAFRQSSDFLYLSGLSEPDALLLLLKSAEGAVESILFVLPRDPAQETWTGYRVGPEGAVQTFGFDRGFNLDQQSVQLPLLLSGYERIYYPFSAPVDNPDGLAAQIQRCCQQLQLKGRSAQSAPQQLHNIEPLLHEMRLIKSEAEQQQMRRAARVSARAGCEQEGYAGDITRTFPVNGRFSAEQKVLYQSVLDAQDAAIAAIKPGACFDDPHQAALRVLVEGLVANGLLKGDVEALIASEAYKPFYMHRTSHWLGLDVHDVGDYQQDGRSRLLLPGMVLTIEPGLYIAPDNLQVEARWRGIGIRIEDDLLVTALGCEVLSKDAPKQIEEIEALMAQDRTGLLDAKIALADKATNE